jgi:hypothetical protein
MLEDLIKLLHEASTNAVNEAMITRGSAWIDALKREYPAAHFIILALLYKTPSEVLNGLANFNKELRPYATNEHALAYIAALQVKLRGKTK